MRNVSTTRRVRRKAPPRPVVFDRHAALFSIAVSGASACQEQWATGTAPQVLEIDNSLRAASHG
jgi:hypothetical protein